MADQQVPLEPGTQYKIETGGPQPTVLMFQPTHYLVVTPDKLQQYEKHLADKLGIKFSSVVGARSQTISFCPGLDDSDEL